jgi:hypothetical protein
LDDGTGEIDLPSTRGMLGRKHRDPLQLAHEEEIDDEDEEEDEDDEAIYKPTYYGFTAGILRSLLYLICRYLYWRLA